MKRENGSEWESIASLVDKVGEEADRLDWPDLIDMISDAYDEMEKETNPAIILFTWQQFFFRLYYRVKAYKHPGRFNTIYETSRLENHENVRMYQIDNYDWKMFVWARKKKFNDYITNNYILVPKDKLTEKERESFEKKCEKTY